MNEENKELLNNLPSLISEIFDIKILNKNNFKSVEPVITSLFQIYEWGKKDQQRHPRMMLRVKNGVFEPRYYPVNGRDVSGKINKHLFIDDMRDKWRGLSSLVAMSVSEVCMLEDGTYFKEYT